MRSTSLLVILLASVALSACTTPVKVHKIRGQQGLQISCSGLGSSWEKCYKKAEHVCRPYGYQKLGQTSDVVDDPDDGFLGWSPGMNSRTLLVRCNTAPAP